MFFNRTPKTQPPPPPGSMDFEVTNIDEARMALDELPPGVAQLAQLHGASWSQRRHPVLPTDRALTGAAVDWLVAMGPLRPKGLGEHYPRIANELAEVWGDRLNAMAALSGLLTDRRGGRRGFPAAVRAELQALHQHLGESAGGAAHTQALQHARELLEAAGYRVIAPGE